MKEAIKNLSGARLGVEKEIPFPDFERSVAGGSRTIRESIRWLEENGWLTVRKNGNRPQIYGIVPGRLKAAGCLVEMESEIQADGGKSVLVNSAKQTEFPSILRFKEKEEPKPTLPVASTGIEPEESDQVSGSAFEIQKLEELEVVRQMLTYGVNKTIIANAFMVKGDEWVDRIYREFNADVQKAHKMESKPAVLASRLKDFDETWRKLQMEPTYDVSPEVISDWQRTIDNNPDDQIPWILRDCAMEVEIPLRKVVTLFDTHGVEV
jgi:hypothetical protein